VRPTVERYLEIETQLARRGYLKSDPDGTWNPESVEALRRFQQEQGLTPDGRLNSLSLIALGLGPQRDTASAVPPPGPPPTVPMP
jgi:peptidoglycan hydrolase-like protein with peptidoglycan-binding domain